MSGPGIDVLDDGPFVHGTKADRHAADLLTPEALHAWRDRLATITAERGEIIN